MNSDQIGPARFARSAYVTIRQSSTQQVRQHSESHWHVLTEDDHEGYIAGETFEPNPRRIVANRRGDSTAGAPR